MANKTITESIEDQADEFADIILEAMGGTPATSDDDDEDEDEEWEEEDDDDSQGDGELGEEEGDQDPEAPEDPEEEQSGELQAEEDEKAEGEPAGELEADGEPRTKSDKINKRIRGLVDRRKAAEADVEKYKAEAEKYKKEAEEAQSRVVRSTPGIPEPEKKLSELKKQLAEAPTAMQIMESSLINPLTNEPYTPAEAQAAIVDYKQNLQIQINDVNDAVVQNMTAARNSEQLFRNEVEPHIIKLMEEYPALDKQSKSYDQDLSEMFQAVINANCKMENGLVSGFKKPPAEFIASFKRHLLKSSAVRANNVSSVDKKIERKIRGAQAERSSKPATEEKAFEDNMFSGFEDAMKVMEV